MTSEASDRTRLTILLAEPIETVPLDKILKKLKKKMRLKVIEALAERTDD